MSLKDTLSQIKDKENTTNLFQHLTNVLTKILLDNPKNAFELFEDYSIQVRSSGYDFTKHKDFDNAQRLNVNFEAIQDNLEKTSKLIGKINIGTPEDPQEPGPCGYVPNMMEESKWFEWAGIGFGVEETFKIFKSLTLLSVQKQVKQVRLWGKIIGSQKDYWVAEGQGDTAAEDGEQPWNVEARGSGVNKLNYWVCNDILGGDWVELPLIQPQHIEIARKVRYIFTGNLEANVITNPYFFGKEKHLLKAQIVRISHSTGIQPKGMQQVREEEQREVDTSEEFKMPSFHVLSQIENWVHTYPSILKCGRLSLMLPPDLDPEKDQEKEMKSLELQDPYEPRLKQLSFDIVSSQSKMNAWKIRTLGDCTDYNPMAKDQNQKINYGVIVIKSIVWPGSVIVCHNKQWQSIYVGYGFKYSSQQFYPKEPQVIQIEAIDKEEQFDPNYPAEIQDAKQEDAPDQ